MNIQVIIRGIDARGHAVSEFCYTGSALELPIQLDEYQKQYPKAVRLQVDIAIDPHRRGNLFT